MPAHVTIASMSVTGFSYQGLQTITTSAGSVTVMVFTVTDASWTSLSLCLGTPPLAMTYASGTASGGMTLHAATFAATVDGSPVSYTVSSPPGGQPLPTGSGTLTSISASVIGLLAGSASLTSATMGGGQC
jgi:hypothetical protein